MRTAAESFVEYRDPGAAAGTVREIGRVVTRPWVIMQVCGGHTDPIVRYGINQMLPPGVELVHGADCPVCVTSVETIDRALILAARPDVVLASFEEMLRAPGSTGDLLSLRRQGADVRTVHSSLDALAIARANPDKRVVFFAIGFETTAPANAMALLQARRFGVRNFSMLLSHVLVPPSITAILQAPGNRVQAFLGPGHVCAVGGRRQYEALVARYRVPIVMTGFEPVDLLQGILMAVRQLEAGRTDVENQYARTVDPAGNRIARGILGKVFQITDRDWRGIGTIPDSGYRIADEFRDHDADRVFEVAACPPFVPREHNVGQGLK